MFRLKKSSIGFAGFTPSFREGVKRAHSEEKSDEMPKEAGGISEAGVSRRFAS